ncbi:SUN domain-containing ossification factor [Takifugu rubripes]|uniref:SUN domain-containing ossification factor n=1 Tax=Takifugu rubripes TaxID=31033 RepID=A0A674MKE6_TAKRU|nr:SUN domain-containing ossification factor [Takifugu rubripes]
MKRLRVLLPCLIVALLCWYPSKHADCSEQSFSNPDHAAGDQHPSRQEPEPEPESEQDQVLEDWAMPASYDLGLETERAALERLETQLVQQEQTVNLHEDEVKETKPDQVSDTDPIAPEPELYPDPANEINVQAFPQDHIQEVPTSSAPESVPAQEHLSADKLAPGELFINSPDLHPGFESQSTTPPNDAEDTPTSQSAEPPQPSAVWVASEGGELPLDTFVFAEQSQCWVFPPELATCENAPFGSPLVSMDEAVVEESQLDQNHSSGPGAEFQSGPDHLDQEQQQDGPELEEELPDLDLEDKPSHQHIQKAGDVPTSRETDPSVPSKEDIPTFDEWKKQVMEVEMEKSQSLYTSTTGSPNSAKKVQKNFKNNYASVECGAKILAANSEAKSTSAILKENMDLYMLNPCSNKIWFVIELCEPIQVKQLDIANFELFSSTPKDFLVSISDRYPTSKWVKLGTFHARDERIVQSFPLDEQLFAKYIKMFIKYIKVELLSHFGSEHFCPLSLIRVFGTSMVEEYEEIAESQYLSERMEYLDEDYDYPPGYQLADDNPNGSKNLLGSATNAILNMVNNIAANVLGATPELEGGAESEDNITAEGADRGGTEASPDFALLASAELEHPASQENSSESSGPSSLKDSHDDRQIVTLVEEEEEEEPRQSTVTLMEEEGEEEEEKREEETRDADRKQRDSRIYCPLFSSLSLSCMASLPELLHRWCSARLAKERLHSLRRRQLSIQTHAHPGPNTPSHTHTLPLIPAPAATPVKEDVPLTEIAPEPKVPSMPQNDGKTVEVHIEPNFPDTHTPELNILLEPSRTVIPTHGFSDPQSSQMWPTSTEEVKVLVAQATGSTPPLQAASILETQQASTAVPTLSASISLQSSEVASSSDVVLPGFEQPVKPVPKTSRPEPVIPPLGDLPTALPLTDVHVDKSAADSGDSQGLNVQASQPSKKPSDSVAQSGEPQQVEDVADEDLLSSSGNSNVQRTATDFYAELQSSGEPNAGAANGNGILLNGGAVHGSNQKESVFMRLNNRIKALEMNMSLSSRYLEELSQRYRKQMEEMQRAFNKTIIKLQNTSRIAQEQDQKQTESIQVLQSQLVNITRLMLNLTTTVGQLQREVSDRQSYLVVSLVLCLFLGLLLFLQCCCRSSPSTSSTNSAPIPRSNHYPSPKRCFSSYDDMNLKRRMTCPIIHSNSLPLCSTEVGPDDLYIVEPLRFSPEKKKKRCKSRSLDKVDFLKEYNSCATLTNGGPKCNGFHPCLSLPSPPPPPLPLPSALPSLPPPVEEVSSLSTCPSMESHPEASSCSSTVNSEESHVSRLAPQTPPYTSASLCNGHGLTLGTQQLATMSRQEKRLLKRQKSRQAELPFSAVPSLQQLIKGNKEISVGTIEMTAVTGHF